GVLDLLPGVLVEVLAGQQGEQALAEGVLRAGQTGPQADQAALGGGRDLDGGSLRGGRLLDADGGAVGKINLLDGAPRFLPRRLGLVADVRLGRRGGDVGRGGRRRGQRLLAAAADDEPADRAEHDHGDDYSKDDDVHNPSSISHGTPRRPDRGPPGPAVPGARTPWPPDGPSATVRPRAARRTVDTAKGPQPCPSRSYVSTWSLQAPPPPRSARATGPPWRWRLRGRPGDHHRADGGAPRGGRQLASVAVRPGRSRPRRHPADRGHRLRHDRPAARPAAAGRGDRGAGPHRRGPAGHGRRDRVPAGGVRAVRGGRRPARRTPGRAAGDPAEGVDG